jgi:hypothetical protein
MALEITSDSVVKILVRRGLEAERKNVLLSEGELGYSIDTSRLFIGDGFTTGGNPIGIKNFGIVANKNDVAPIMLPGDLVKENNILYFLRPDSIFEPTAPELFFDPISIIPTLEFLPSNNSLRFSLSGLGDGFVLPYSTDPSTYINRTIQREYGKINFDARYISLCAANNSWYLGNIFNKQVKNNLDATLNVDTNIFINEINSSPYQIQIYAKDPSGTANSLIEAVSGSMIIRGKTGVGLSQNLPSSTISQISIANNGGITLASNRTGQGYGSPGNLVNGVTRFLSSVYMDQDLWVAGTLSAATLVAINTTSTTTSALSVFTFDSITDTAYIGNGNPLNSQNILRVTGDSGPGLRDYLIVKDDSKGLGGCNVLINQGGNQNGNYTLSLSGSLGVTSTGADGAASDRVDISTGTLKTNVTTGNHSYSTLTLTAPTMTQTNATSLQITTPNLLVQGGASNTIIRSNAGGVSDYVDVQGNLRVTRDITAYYTSDLRFKENTETILNPLDKISILNGVHFDWKKISGKEGSSYGIIAQDVEKILPEAVITRDDGYKAVNYNMLIPLLIESIKELKTQVETLKKQI